LSTGSFAIEARGAPACILVSFRDLRGLRQFTSSLAKPNVFSIASTSRIELALSRFVTEAAYSFPTSAMIAGQRRFFLNCDELAALRNADLGEVIASKRRSNEGA
jgi:hypothetical protein